MEDDKKQTPEAATPAAVPSWLEKILEILELIVSTIAIPSAHTIETAQREIVNQKIADLKADLPK